MTRFYNVFAADKRHCKIESRLYLQLLYLYLSLSDYLVVSTNVPWEPTLIFIMNINTALDTYYLPTTVRTFCNLCILMPHDLAALAFG